MNIYDPLSKADRDWFPPAILDEPIGDLDKWVWIEAYRAGGRGERLYAGQVASRMKMDLYEVSDVLYGLICRGYLQHLCDDRDMWVEPLFPWAGRGCKGRMAWGYWVRFAKARLRAYERDSGRNLTAIDRRILLLLAEHYDPFRECPCSPARLAKGIKCTEKTASRSIRRLVAAGLIQYLPGRRGRGHVGRFRLVRPIVIHPNYRYLKPSGEGPLNPPTKNVI